MIELQSDSAFYWLKQFGLDGYRHDATKHIPRKFWRELTRKIREDIIEKERRPIFQIGETYGSRELIASYISSGLLDAQFDFPFYFEMRDCLLDTSCSFTSLARSLEQSFDHFGHHSTMGYISGNHDQARFISLAGGALAMQEDHREAGFAREVGVGDPIGYKMLSMLHAINMAIPGIPVNFYGDEIGMPGANDPDNRRMMRFEKLNTEEKSSLERFRQLTRYRKNSLALIYGETAVIHADSTTLAIERRYFDESVICLFNKSDRTRTVNCRSVLQPSLGLLEFELEPWSYQFHFYEN